MYRDIEVSSRGSMPLGRLLAGNHSIKDFNQGLQSLFDAG